MAYTKSTDFAIKDNLLSGNPSKLVRGSEIDAEFDALEVEDALNLKTAAAPSSFVERSGANVTLGSVAGTNTITAAGTPAVTAYATGQTFQFTPANTNTGAATINIDSLGAINIKKRSSGGLVDVVAGDLVSGQPYSLTKVSTAFVLNEARPYSNGADVASASTINLDTATGDYVRVTGTTAVTAITLAQGEQRTIRFADALTFTHGASLILPGSSNITTAAGDIAVVRGEASSVVRCVSYTKAAGTPVVDSSTQIFTVTPTVGSNQLTIAFPSMTLDFRSTTAGSGVVTRVTGTPANLVITNGSTLGTTNGVQSDLVVIVMNNSGTLEGAIVNLSGTTILDETTVISTTAEGGLGAADSASVIYSTTARSNLAYRVIGILRSTQATAGAWVTSPSFVQGLGTIPSVKVAMKAHGDAPIFACRAWVNFNGTGTPAIRASGNVSSITDNGTGDYTVNFTTAMPDSDYCATIAAAISGTSTTTDPGVLGTNAPTTSSFRFGTRSSTAGTAGDPIYVNVAIFR